MLHIIHNVLIVILPLSLSKNTNYNDTCVFVETRKIKIVPIFKSDYLWNLQTKYFRTCKSDEVLEL